MQIEEKELRDLFMECGLVQRVMLKKKDNGFTFAHVHYQSIEEASAAIDQLNRRKMGGRTIKVQFSREMNPNENHQNWTPRDKSPDRTDHFGPRKFNDFQRQSDTRRRFEESGEFYGRGRGGRGRLGGFHEDLDYGTSKEFREGGQRANVKCFKCQGEGHISKACPFEGEDRKGNFGGDMKGGKGAKQGDKMTEEGFSDF
jgi:RNA recognition motif-containing protein